jgi:solute carrier family 10 (sodium/bile acid cotransporter), member 7
MTRHSLGRCTNAGPSGPIFSRASTSFVITALLRSLRLDPYLVALLGAVVLASMLPVRGAGRAVLDIVVYIAIAGLFLLYGARLSPAQVWTGLLHWRLQITVFMATYVLFPAMGLAAWWLLQSRLDDSLALGVAFLCILPSTVQSSIGFTSIARGNVAAALSSASMSNLAGVALTPLLASLLLSTGAHQSSSEAVPNIALQLLLPFVVGQVLRPVIGEWLLRRKAATAVFDRSCILLVVYSAFSAGVIEGIWSSVDAGSLALLLLVDAVLLALALALTTLISRRLRFSPEDEIAIVFCGSKKSMATGIPMANVLLPASTVALAVVPLMIFHQMQLFVCAVLAKGYAAREQAESVIDRQV